MKSEQLLSPALDKRESKGSFSEGTRLSDNLVAQQSAQRCGVKFAEMTNQLRQIEA